MEHRGPSAVLGSIRRGASRLGLPLVVDPKSEDEVHDWSLVVSGATPLRRAIALKESGRISRLLAGPNIFVRADDDGGVLAHDAVDRVIVPSEWVRAAYVSQCPDLVDRVAIWPAGVDTQFFTPKLGERARVLVYQKNGPIHLLEEVLALLRAKGMPSHVIRYGQYSQPEYREALAESSIAIFLSQSESQGIALAESWAMDVPTYCWDPQTLSYGGWTYDPVTSCPYLTEHTGERWKTLDELEVLIARKTLGSHAPRDWVLSEMTDEVCMERLIRLFQTKAQTG